MPEFKNFIAGQWVPASSGETFDNINPADTNDVIGKFPLSNSDDVARAVIDQQGYGEYFTHRTGHSIDAREIHGSGPNLDNLETRDVRQLIPGVGFSIEPGIYIRGEIGMRTEVNGYIDGTALVITPSVYQHELIVA